MPTFESLLQAAITQCIRQEMAGLRQELAALGKAVERAASRKGAAAPGGARGGRRPAGNLKAARVRAIRAKLGVSQASFARMAGVTPVAVYFWESGKTTPSLERERILLRLDKKGASTGAEAAPAAKSRRRERR